MSSSNTSTSNVPAAYSALSLSGKVAFITGGSSGIGAESARLFAARGAKVVIASRREVQGNAVVNEIKKSGGEAFFVKTDVNIESDISNAIKATVSKYGRLDIAFNNAGVFGQAGPTHTITSDNVDQVFGINVKGVFLSMKYEIEQFLKQAAADKSTVDVSKLDHSIQPNNYYLNSHPYTIINTSSALGRLAFPNISTYVASKHAVEGLTKVAALDYAKQGIRVNNIGYGYIWSEMTEGFTGPGMASQIKIGRVGQAREAAEAAAFLASNASSYITGASIDVSGGALA